MCRLSSNLHYACRCNKSAFVEGLFFVWCTLIAQVVLSLRYEITPSSICSDLQHCAHIYLRGVIGYMLSR